jgi:hypothetical protein
MHEPTVEAVDPDDVGQPAVFEEVDAANESASLRVSTSTTAPIAPRTRSSHEPETVLAGRAEQVEDQVSSSDTRPKSIATVVVTLFGVADRSSCPTLAAVITASVVSGMISDTDPTKVVLPTPKPPATTILAEIAAVGDPLRSAGGPRNPAVRGAPDPRTGN